MLPLINGVSNSHLTIMLQYIEIHVYLTGKMKEDDINNIVVQEYASVLSHSLAYAYSPVAN
jgi:hypothetical protein